MISNVYFLQVHVHAKHTTVYAYPLVLCISCIYLALIACLMTHQGPGKVPRACPGKEAAGEVLRPCEGQLEGTAGVEGGTVLCGHKHKEHH